ncbi:MAG: nicotinate phosphoribosyltransferase [Gemmatimonadetes bacterium]|nr:nicotinate phosphoribosyltransferase [Gemmatimonadota bacterium]
MLDRVYRGGLGLVTDLYELTMAYAYWRSGRGEQEAVFNVLFRSNPFEGGFTLSCGQATVMEYLERFRFEADDLEYLAGLVGSDGKPLFQRDFLGYLSELRCSCDLDVVPEGRVVFPQEPIARVRGPIIQAQLLETALLNILNFQSLIATKAARVCMAAQGEPVIEFGLRRAQGIDGGLSASRAAYVGGCVATSNVLAGKLYGIPVRGTQAHSWIMSFETELDAFRAYAESMPNNCVFLVDTYETLQGVRHAVEIGRWLRERGQRLLGIRLDSGDLAYLSIQARKILDDAGFTDTTILASNELDEHVITSLKLQGAKIVVWGVGTRLVTGYDHPALGGVYKLTAVRPRGGKWEHRIKVSEQAAKITTPGVLQVRRYFAGGEFIGDMIYDEEYPPPADAVMADPLDMTRRKHFPSGSPYEELLVPVYRGGKRVYDPPPLEQVRRYAQEELSRFHGGIKRLVNPHIYPVGLELGLHQRKTRLVLRARGLNNSALAP